MEASPLIKSRLGLGQTVPTGSFEGPVLDWLNAAQPGAWIGYKGLFIFGAIVIFLSAFILRKIDVEI